MALEGDGEPGAGQGPGDADPADAMHGASDPGELRLEPGPESAMIEVPPTPGGDVIIQGGPAAAFRTPEGGIASMGETDVDPAFLEIESDPFDPPGSLQGQESGEEIDVAHGRAPIRLAMEREYHGPGGYFPGEIAPREEGGFARRDPSPRVRQPESRSGSRVGRDLPVNCRAAAPWSKLEEPGRRIGQRGDATRAPTQVPRPGWAARCRPSASRDWPKSDKSIDSSCRHRLAWQTGPLSSHPLSRHTMPYACSGMVTKREFLPTAKPEEPIRNRKALRSWVAPTPRCHDLLLGFSPGHGDPCEVINLTLNNSAN